MESKLFHEEAKIAKQKAKLERKERAYLTAAELMQDKADRTIET